MNDLFLKNIKYSLNDWLIYISNLHDKSIDMGLDRVRKVANMACLTKICPNVITVTGTNGKGTTCHILESIFISAGFKVGVYSSPHLIRYTERIRIQGLECSEKDLCKAFINIELYRKNISLTYFEYTTLVALYLFKKTLLDIVILEVGLGGRLDATNIIDADISVITNIDIEHTDLLGFNRELIGYEKSGIFRKNSYGVIGELNIPNSVLNFSKKIGSKLFCYGKDWFYKKNNNSWSWFSNFYKIYNLPLPNVPLVNAATALSVIHCLMKINLKFKNKIKENVICKGLKIAKLPGRFQIINKKPLIILDVAHNPHAIKYLIAKLSELPKVKNRRTLAVVGILRDKDIKNMIRYLSKQVTDWYIATLSEYRGTKACEISKYLSYANEFNSVEKAWKKAFDDAEEQDLIIVCGSFYTVSRVMMILNNSKI
ncbi:bifunctional tetrahydrofolate synthase/dihydrofolate synthase [Candidatus Providencia siddallii]|uniref:Dihydrofolate synthase/folylpolyglutamate synthase n=1 Tax=Candidatus Providencia siddallii TaxID=1715285 RepID=A0ABP1CDE0_9GAMM